MSLPSNSPPPAGRVKWHGLSHRAVIYLAAFAVTLGLGLAVGFAVGLTVASSMGVGAVSTQVTMSRMP